LAILAVQAVMQRPQPTQAIWPLILPGTYFPLR
jgi:hypothetical protein